MKRFEYCKKCGEAVPIFDNGLCKECFTAELDAARTEPRKPPRPTHINIGLKTCSVCGIRAVSLRGMCSACYKRAQYAALTPEQLEEKRAQTRVSNERRRDARRAAKAKAGDEYKKLATDNLI